MVDTFWRARAVDLEVGDFILTPADASAKAVVWTKIEADQ